MTEQSRSTGKADGPQYEVARFRDEDADGIVKLFKAVYGAGYPIKLFYDPKAVIEANRSGDYHSTVARTPAGGIIGVHHLYRSAPFRDLYEWGVGLVLREYRGAGVSGKIAMYMFEKVVSELGMPAVFGEAVCNHLHMQRLVAKAGFIDTALEVALMPAEAYTKEKTSIGRVATLLQFRCFNKKPHTVFLPAIYEHELRFMYEGIQDVREFAASDQGLRGDGSSRAEMTVFDFAKVARIAVHETAADFSFLLEGLETQAVNRSAVVIQVWLKLSDPAVGSAVEILRGRGYFLAGPLPRWFDVDGLLMQKLLCSPDFEAIQLHSDRARAILDMIRSDYGRVVG